MKHFTTNITIVFALIGFFLTFSFIVTPPSYSQAVDVTPTPAEEAAAPTPTVASPEPGATPAATPGGGKKTADKTGDDPEWMLEVAGAIASFMIGIGGAIAWLGGWLLDLVVYHTVVRAGAELRGGIGVAINDLWTIVRDLFNLLFIFTLIYIGLMTILKSSDSSPKRLLGGVIAAALLINFSLFITKTIVDFSNLAAYQVYQQVVARDINAADIQDLRPNALTGTVEGSPETQSPSGAFMNAMQLTTFASTENTNYENWGSAVKVFIFGFLMMLFMIIAGFVFAAGAFLLLARFITLIVLMILSPAMFLIFFFPALASLGRDWWQRFIRNAFVAPAYLFMLLMSLIVIERFSVGRESTFNQMMENKEGNLASDFGGLLLFFFLAAGFLYASVIVAQKMGAAGASTAMKIADYGKNKVQGGMTSFAKNPMYLGSLGRWGARGTAHGLSSAASDGYNKIMSGDSRLAKRFRGGAIDRSIAGGLESGKNVKMGLSRSIPERDEAKKKRVASLTQERRVTDLQASLRAVDPSTGSPDRARRQQAFADMSNPQLIEIAKSAEGKKLIKENAHMLTASQMKALSDSNEFNDEQKADFAKAQKDAVVRELGTPGGLTFKDATKDQLGALGVEELRKEVNAIQLTEDKIKSLDMVDPYKEQIKQARKDALAKVVRNDTTVGGKTIPNLIKGMSAEDVANLPDGVFVGASPTEEANIRKFLQTIPFNYYNRIAARKDISVQKEIRRLLASMRNPMGTPFEREIDDWLDNDNIGRRFGIG